MSSRGNIILGKQNYLREASVPRPSLREKLASSAVDTLHVHGFKGCSIQDITEAAGVPKGSFFNHFENKEELAIDSLRRYFEGARADMLFAPSVPPLQLRHN